VGLFPMSWSAATTGAKRRQRGSAVPWSKIPATIVDLPPDCSSSPTSVRNRWAVSASGRVERGDRTISYCSCPKARLRTSTAPRVRLLQEVEVAARERGIIRGDLDTRDGCETGGWRLMAWQPIWQPSHPLCIDKRRQCRYKSPVQRPVATPVDTPNETTDQKVVGSNPAERTG